MMTEDVIYRANQEKEFAKIKGSLEKAIEALDNALHYLHETSDYESDMLDTAVDEIMEVKTRLEALMRD
jgi:hypothetical protein